MPGNWWSTWKSGLAGCPSSFRMATGAVFSAREGGIDVRYAPGKHPNSQKNLRSPWAKGQSGNPRGRTPGSSTRLKLLSLVDEGLKAEAQQILLEAFSRGEPWAIELVQDG